jgi:hypothetical protein
MAGCDGCTGYLEDIRMVAATLLKAFRELRGD